MKNLMLKMMVNINMAVKSLEFIKMESQLICILEKHGVEAVRILVITIIFMMKLNWLNLTQKLLKLKIFVLWGSHYE